MTGARPEGVKHVEGFGPVKPGAHRAMAWRMRDLAMRTGLKVMWVMKSRSVRSNAHYIQIVDRSGRHWKLRIADHYRPLRSEVPNFDLISRDGEAGQGWVEDCIARIASGTAEWFDPRGTDRPASGKQQRRIRHAQGERPVGPHGRPRR